MTAVLPYRRQAGNHGFSQESLLAILQGSLNEIWNAGLPASK
jgi:hypothetical protein